MIQIPDIGTELEAIQKANIVRIDINIFFDHVGMWMFDQNWVPSKHDPSGYTEKGSRFDVDAYLKTLEDAGWTIRRWQFPRVSNGARAFKGEPWPVRSKTEITSKRDEYREKLMRYGADSTVDLSSVDLAYDM
jgi:hypothetical protein